MSTFELERRLSAVECQIEQLKARVFNGEQSPNHWVDKIAGSFSSTQDRAAFDEAMRRYGRQWRTAQRPTACRK